MTDGSVARVRRRQAAAGGSQGPVGPGRTVATAAGALVVVTLPMFLVGSLSGRLTADLQLGGTAIGVLVALFFGAGAISSIPGGRLTDRIGATAALRLAAAIAAICSLGIAALGRGFGILMVLFMISGTAVAMADTGGVDAGRAGGARPRSNARVAAGFRRRRGTGGGLPAPGPAGSWAGDPARDVRCVDRACRDPAGPGAAAGYRGRDG